VVPWLEVDVRVLASFLARDVLSFWLKSIGGKYCWWCDPCSLSRYLDFPPKLLLEYSSAVLTANPASHCLNDVMLLYSRQQQYPCSRCGWRVYAVHPSECTPFHEVGLAYVSFVLGMKPSMVQYLGYPAPMFCRHWCFCLPNWVEIGRWLLVARYTLQNTIRNLSLIAH